MEDLSDGIFDFYEISGKGQYTILTRDEICARDTGSVKHLNSGTHVWIRTTVFLGL